MRSADRAAPRGCASGRGPIRSAAGQGRRGLATAGIGSVTRPTRRWPIDRVAFAPSVSDRRGAGNGWSSTMITPAVPVLVHAASACAAYFARHATRPRASLATRRYSRTGSRNISKRRRSGQDAQQICNRRTLSFCLTDATPSGSVHRRLGIPSRGPTSVDGGERISAYQ